MPGQRGDGEGRKGGREGRGGVAAWSNGGRRVVPKFPEKRGRLDHRRKTQLSCGLRSRRCQGRAARRGALQDPVDRQKSKGSNEETIWHTTLRMSRISKSGRVGKRKIGKNKRNGTIKKGEQDWDNERTPRGEKGSKH